MRSVTSGWRAADLLVHLLAPSPCLGCGDPLPARAPLALCAGCRAALPAGARGVCDGCGRPIGPAVPGRGGRRPAASIGLRCGGCRARPPAYRRLVAPWRYAPPLDAVIRALKYGRREELAADLGTALAGAVGAELAGCDLVVPVPLHWRRRLARGFNQADRIARPLAARLGLPRCRAVVRRRATRKQTGLGRAERRRNLAGAFAVPRPEAVAGRVVALVDDVATTGSTLDAVAGRLLAAGATAVVAVAAARRALD